MTDNRTAGEEEQCADRVKAIQKEFEGREHLMPAEIERPRGALQMISEQTIIPEVFPEEDLESDSLQIKSALLISIAALEGKVDG